MKEDSPCCYLSINKTIFQGDLSLLREKKIAHYFFFPGEIFATVLRQSGDEVTLEKSRQNIRIHFSNMKRSLQEEKISKVVVDGAARFLFSDVVIDAVCFSPDGSQLSICTCKGTVNTANILTGIEEEPKRFFPDFFEYFLALQFSPNGKLLAIGSHDGTTKVWEALTGQNARVLVPSSSKPVTSLRFSPDSKQLVSGSDDKNVRVWHVGSGERICTLRGHTDDVTVVCFSPDGKRLASGSSDNTMRVWDLATRECVTCFSGHTDGVTSVCFSPDGKQLASGSMDRKVRVWDLATSQCVTTFHGSTAYFSPDGKRLATTCSDKNLRLWDLQTVENSIDGEKQQKKLKETK